MDRRNTIQRQLVFDVVCKLNHPDADEVYAAMKARADEHSTYEYRYKYVYRPAEEGDGPVQHDGDRA